tara:strand:+ start:1374 stop:2267 length:894 start_codon:yes stop_codon:yes gene_type:complete
MIKLKDLLFEYVAHSKKSLEWVSMDYIPMTPKTMKQIMGDTVINAFHNVDWFNAKKQIPNIIGKKKSISTFTADTKGNLSWGGGVQTMGGIVLQVQGKVLVAGTEDLGSVPDEAGRRWIHPNVLGKILGIDQFKGGGGGIYYRKSLYKYDKKLEDMLFKYKTSLLKAPTDSAEDNARFPDYTNKQKAELIKRYINASNKFLLANKKKIKTTFMNNVNNPKITTFMSKYGYNELLVYDTQVKDAYIVLDIIGNANDFEKSERNMKRAEDGIKGYVKGKIYKGFASGAKKFIKQRGGKV